MSTIAAALLLGQGQCVPTERQPAAVSSAETDPLNGSKVQTIQKIIAAGGVKRIKNSGPSVVRTNWTTGLSLSAAQVVSFSEEDDFDIVTLHKRTFAPLANGSSSESRSVS